MFAGGLTKLKLNSKVVLLLIKSTLLNTNPFELNTSQLFVVEFQEMREIASIEPFCVMRLITHPIDLSLLYVIVGRKLTVLVSLGKFVIGTLLELVLNL